MFVKGMAFTARKNLLVRELGEEKWNAFFEAYTRENPAFSRLILAVTDIDMHEFTKFNDAVIDRFYGGDQKAYFRFGEMSAEWALRDGPLKEMRIAKDYRAFIERGTAYHLYYSEGKAETEFKEDVYYYRIRGVPEPYRHVYLEYTPVGYVRRGLELTGCQVLDTQCIKGFSKGDAEVYYRLLLKIL